MTEIFIGAVKKPLSKVIGESFVKFGPALLTMGASVLTVVRESAKQDELAAKIATKVVDNLAKAASR